jgi:hypothetical protein
MIAGSSQSLHPTTSTAQTPGHTRTELRTALEHLLSVHPSRGAHFATLRGTGLKQVTSANWSGYAETGSGFTSVTGKWKEPKISGCNAASPLSAVVFWVGLDGFNNGTVEQDGTAAICGGGNPITYLTWWETFPTNNIQFVGMTVKPGDNISASVVRTGTKYTFKVTDSTTSGNNVLATATCAASICKNQSAEWIAEAPSANGGEVPLPKFTPWPALNIRACNPTNCDPPCAFGPDPCDAITMNNSNPHNEAKPGPLNSAHNSFVDKWLA